MSDTDSNEQQSVSNTDQQCFLYVSHPLQMWKTTRSNSKMYLGLKITSEARGYSSSSKTWPKMTQTYRCQSLICWCHWKLHHEIDNKKHMENSGQEWEGAAHIRGQNAIKSFVRHKLLITWKSKPQRGMSTHCTILWRCQIWPTDVVYCEDYVTTRKTNGGRSVCVWCV